jgi:hypothetical protein
MEMDWKWFYINLPTGAVFGTAVGYLFFNFTQSFRLMFIAFFTAYFLGLQVANTARKDGLTG